LPIAFYTNKFRNQRRSIAQRKACGMASLRATQERLTRYRFSTRRCTNAIGLLYMNLAIETRKHYGILA